MVVPFHAPAILPVMLSIGAVRVSALLHMPPGDAFASTTAWPSHTVVGPVIGLTTGAMLTVTTCVARAVHQVLVVV